MVGGGRVFSGNRNKEVSVNVKELRDILLHFPDRYVVRGFVQCDDGDACETGAITVDSDDDGTVFVSLTVDRKALVKVVDSS